MEQVEEVLGELAVPRPAAPLGIEDLGEVGEIAEHGRFEARREVRVEDDQVGLVVQEQAARSKLALPMMAALSSMMVAFAWMNGGSRSAKRCRMEMSRVR